MKYTTLLLATLALTTTLASAQDLTHSAPEQDHPVFLVGATVHTITGETIENGVVSINDGKIGIVAGHEIMSRINLTPNTEIIDLTGKHLYPGMIDSIT